MPDSGADIVEIEADLRVLDERERELRATLRSLRTSGLALGAMSLAGLVSWMVDPRLWGLSAAVVAGGVVGLGLVLGLWRLRFGPQLSELAEERERLFAAEPGRGDDSGRGSPDAV